MKKIYLQSTLTALKNNLAKNTVTPEGQALIDEITTILSDLANDPDVEYNETDVMSKVTEAAKAAGAAAAAEVASAFKVPKAENKLDVKKARELFANSMRAAAGKGKGAFANEFRDACAKNGITGLPSLLEVFPEIQTKFEKTSILSKLRKLGNYALQIPISTQEDDSVDVRAKGHVIYDAETGLALPKLDQALTLTPKTLNLGAIYKKISVPKLMSYQTGNDTALFSWLANELVERIDNELQRVILVGDGRAAGAVDKISSFETIGIKTAADAYTVYKETANALPTLADVRALVDQMDNSKPITLYANSAVITNLEAYQYAAGGAVSYITDEVLASQLGVAEIVRTKMLIGAVPAKAVAAAKYPLIVAMQGESYGYVGSDLFSVDYEKWDYNQDVLLAEIFAGGGIIKPLSTGVLKVAVPAA